MDPNQNTYNVKWSSEEEASIPSGQPTRLNQSHIPWNSFPLLSESRQDIRDSSQQSWYYPFEDHTPSMYQHISLSQDHGHDYLNTPFEDVHWPSQYTHKDDDLPPISSDFDYDVLHHIDPPEEIHGSTSTYVEDKGCSNNLDKIGKFSRQSKFSLNGTWRDAFPGQACSQIRDILIQETGTGKSTVNRALSLKGTVEVGLNVLSGNPKRLKEAIETLGIGQPRKVTKKRGIFLGNQSRAISDGYARHFKVTKETAALHLNKSLDERSAKLLLDPVTFDQGAELVHLKRRQQDNFKLGKVGETKDDENNFDFSHINFSVDTPMHQSDGYDQFCGGHSRSPSHDQRK